MIASPIHTSTADELLETALEEKRRHYDGAYLTVLNETATLVEEHKRKEISDLHGEIKALRLSMSELMAASRQANNSVLVPLDTWNAVQKRIREPMLAGYALDEMVRLRKIAAAVKESTPPPESAFARGAMSMQQRAVAIVHGMQSTARACSDAEYHESHLDTEQMWSRVDKEMGRCAARIQALALEEQK